MTAVELDVFTLAERPDLAPRLGDFPSGWAAFMYEDPVANLHYSVAERAYPEYTLLAVDRADPARAVARAFSVPFAVPDDLDDLPDGGWDDVVLSTTRDREEGRRGTEVSALEITIQPDLRGKGLAGVVLAAMRDNARRRGHRLLVAPVRPNEKSRYPTEPMRTYARRVRGDGLPVDAWLRVHMRAGARIVKVAPRSMTIPGTLAQWRAWTGLPFDSPGPVLVPGALNPVFCDPANDLAVYVEPNVWVCHDL